MDIHGWQACITRRIIHITRMRTAVTKVIVLVPEKKADGHKAVRRQ